MRYVDTLKKIVVLSVAVISVSIIYTSNTKAADGGLLQQIADNTFGTMTTADKILKLLIQNSADSIGSNDPDDGKDGSYSFTLDNLGKFKQFGSDLANSQIKQDSSQVQVFADLLGIDISKLQPALSVQSAEILGQLPNANELAYASLLGHPPANKGAFTPYNYVKNASLFSYQRPIPDSGWQGKPEDKAKYVNYFNSITSIQSFNSYLLTQIQADYDADRDPTITGLRNDLVKQASDDAFIRQVAGQPMGKVFRQLLLFTAQNFVLNAQIQNSMRQLVAATAMQNSLIILFNMQNENQMIRNAKGLPLAR